MDAMTRGWIIGDFTPSILKTSQFEIGYLSRKKGHDYAHVHNEADEYNILIKGAMKLNNEILSEGDIFIIKKGMLAKPFFLEDSNIICIKCPSKPSDKYIY
jgi:mannose-6-phosphate isomerase-like protein (cupin superfamily)